MKIRWTLADLLDLEYFLGRDEQVLRRDGEQALGRRDRVIYLARIAPKLKKTRALAPQELLHLWLRVRQHSLGGNETRQQEEILPGGVWRELARLLGWLALLFGALSGLGLAAAFLAYTGRAPLNVSAFLGIFVALPLLLLLGQSLFFILGRQSRRAARTSLLQMLLMRLASSCADWMYARARRSATAGQRLGFSALLGRLRSRREQARLFVWPVFIFLQLGAIGFTAGVLGLTLARVVFSDMAFGWQSSLQLSAGQVAEAARCLALPWSWFLQEGLGYPSLEQVQGTQIVLKEGIYNLDTKNLVSWWPFLCMSLVCYGLLPRCIMLLAGLSRYRRQLEGLELRYPETRRLLQRMTTPQVETRGTRAGSGRPAPAAMQRPVPAATPDPALRDDSPPQEPEIRPAPAGVFADEEQARPGHVAAALSAGMPLRPEAVSKDELARLEAQAAAAPVLGGRALQRLILAPEELLAGLDRNQLGEALVRRVGPGEIGVAALPFAESGETELLAQIRSEHEAGGLDEIYLLQEAWMPPLQETCKLLERLRAAVGLATPLTVLLLGRPQGRARLGPVRPEQAEVWRQRMQGMADPSLDTLELVEAP